jgi:hypothetical protein
MTLYSDSIAILKVTSRGGKIVWDVNEFPTAGTGGPGDETGQGKGPPIPTRTFELHVADNKREAKLVFFVGREKVFEGEYNGEYSSAGIFRGVWG